MPARAAILAVGECGEPANPGGRKCKELQKRRCRGELECALRGTMLEGAIQRSIHARLQGTASAKEGESGSGGQLSAAGTNSPRPKWEE